MSYTLEKFSVRWIGELYHHEAEPFAWITLSLEFEREGKPYHPDIEMRVAIAYSDTMTIREIHEAALAEAKSMLSAAAKVVGESDLSELRRVSAEFEDRQGLGQSLPPLDDL